jgi:hypothetical protein
MALISLPPTSIPTHAHTGRADTGSTFGPVLHRGTAPTRRCRVSRMPRLDVRPGAQIMALGSGDMLLRDRLLIARGLLRWSSEHLLIGVR